MTDPKNERTFGRIDLTSAQRLAAVDERTSPGLEFDKIYVSRGGTMLLTWVLKNSDKQLSRKKIFYTNFKSTEK